MEQKAYPRLESIWWRGQDFYKQCCTQAGQMAFFHSFRDPGGMPGHITRGLVVMVSVQLLDTNVELCLRARVEQVNRQGPDCGFLLVCLPEDRHLQQQLLAASCGQDVPGGRRCHERVPCQLPVQVRLRDGSPAPQTVQGAWVPNISRQGVFVDTPHLVPCDTHLELEITFPDRPEPFTITGQVRSVMARADRPGLGLQFVYESAFQNGELRRHVSNLRRAR